MVIKMISGDFTSGENCILYLMGMAIPQYAVFPLVVGDRNPLSALVAKPLHHILIDPAFLQRLNEFFT